MLKTFWGGQTGWRERQLDDGTVIWTAPDGRQYMTAPGSRLLFQELSEPTARVQASRVPARHTLGLTMPRRKTTRAEDRARRVQRQRELNEQELAVDDAGAGPGDGQLLVGGDDEDRRG